jgi:hypothetical protein
MSIAATIFPPAVTGYTSPYPTVVTVTITYQKASSIVVIFASGSDDSIRYSATAPRLTARVENAMIYNTLRPSKSLLKRSEK